jgi:hypothetical protein
MASSLFQIFYLKGKAQATFNFKSKLQITQEGKILKKHYNLHKYLLNTDAKSINAKHADYIIAWQHNLN